MESKFTMQNNINLQMKEFVNVLEDHLTKDIKSIQGTLSQFNVEIK